VTTLEELLEQAKAEREAARIFLRIGREMLRGVDQERLIRQSNDLDRHAADLEAQASSLSPAS
jgi:hypothetical protein